MLVPLNSPVSSVVPANRQIIWAGSRIQIAAVSESEICVACTFLGSLLPAWTLTLDVTDGDSQLAAGPCSAIVVADRYFLLKTEARSRNSAGQHKRVLRRIGSDGSVMWMLAKATLDQVGLVDDGLLVIHYCDPLSAPVSRLPLEANLRDAKSGTSLASHAVSIPEHIWPQYEHAASGRLRARLEHDGRYFAVRVSLAPDRGNAAPVSSSVFLYALPFQQTVVRRWGFVCPDCLRPGSLQIVQSIQLAPDGRADDIVVQVIACNQCAFKGLAVYEESKRGALDAEGWQHTGYRMAEAAIEAMRTAIGQCPDPTNAACQCATHSRLGQKDESGRWSGLAGCEGVATFPMRLVDANA
jgi:hypothetical protein